MIAPRLPAPGLRILPAKAGPTARNHRDASDGGCRRCIATVLTLPKSCRNPSRRVGGVYLSVLPAVAEEVSIPIGSSCISHRFHSIDLFVS